MGAREDVLGRIRAALRDVPGDEEVEIPRNYRRHREQPEGTVERFCERVADYKATVEQVPADGVGAAVEAALRRVGASRVGVPAGLPAQWASLGDGTVTLVADTEVVYKVTERYAPESERSIRFDDPAIGIDWPVGEPLLSDKDAKAPFLGDVAADRLPLYVA